MTVLSRQLPSRARLKIDDLVAALEKAGEASENLDRMIWAYLGRRDWPLDHLDEEEWREQAREGDRGATLSTDMTRLCRWMDETWMDHHIKMEFKRGMARIEATITCPGIGFRVSGKFHGELAFSEARLGAAIACLQAHDRTEELKNAILDHGIMGLIGKLPEWKDWEFIKVGSYYRGVNHEHRLMASSGSPALEAAARNPFRINDPVVLLSMRRHYLEVFPGQNPKISNPEISNLEATNLEDTPAPGPSPS